MKKMSNLQIGKRGEEEGEVEGGNGKRKRRGGGRGEKKEKKRQKNQSYPLPALETPLFTGMVLENMSRQSALFCKKTWRMLPPRTLAARGEAHMPVLRAQKVTTNPGATAVRGKKTPTVSTQKKKLQATKHTHARKKINQRQFTM